MRQAAVNTSGRAAMAGSPEVREVQREPDLAADLRTGDIFASEHAKTKTQTIAKLVLAARHGLKLTFAEIRVFRIAAIQLASESEPAAEVVQQGNASGIHLTARVFC